MHRHTNTIRTTRPNDVALHHMRRAANDAARTWTVQEWVGRLAARAGPRDYMGQLRQLYNDVVTKRWRYVKEPGERVPGTADAVLGHVLGADYNRCPSCRTNAECDVCRTAWRERGWGDCDDVSTLIASGVLALGMQPYFRVVPGHVSVVAKTPRGETVNMDAVGYPDKPFGWAAPGPARLHPVAEAGPMFMSGPAELGHGRMHFVAVPYGDTRGPRVLAMPGWAHRYFAMGHAVEDTPAVDQYGQAFRFDAATDTWVPGGMRPPVHPMVAHYQRLAPWGRRRRRRKRWRVGRGIRRAGARIMRKRRRIRKVVRRVRRVARPVMRVARRVGRGAANVGGALARSKAFREVAARAAQVVGVPPQATRAALATAGEINRLTRGRLASIARKDPRAALRIAARGGAVGLKSALVPFGAVELEQNGGRYMAAPVEAMVGVDGVYAFGQLETAETPTPGQWYRVKKGDTLTKVAGRAYGVSGGERLRRSKWINEVEENRVYWVNPKSDFAKRHYPAGIIVFNPRFACPPEDAIQGKPGKCYPLIYIPVAKGDRPPTEPEIDAPTPGELTDVILPPEPELPAVVDPPEPPGPVVLPPTDEPIEPEDPEPEVVVDLPPTDVPAVPTEPTPAPEYPVPPTDTPPEPPPEDVVPSAPEVPPAQPPGYVPGVPEPDPADLPGYTIPVCPPGMAYNYQMQQCWPADAPLPQPPQPQQPQQPQAPPSVTPDLPPGWQPPQLPPGTPWRPPGFQPPAQQMNPMLPLLAALFFL